MKKRAIVRVQLSPQVKEKLDELCDSRGMTQIAVMSRLVDWFCEQNELVQAAVLGQISETLQSDLAEQLLREMAEESQPSGDGNPRASARSNEEAVSASQRTP